MRWIKLPKDYDLTILYHLEKDNVVADALNRKSSSLGILAAICVEERPLSRGTQRLDNCLFQL